MTPRRRVLTLAVTVLLGACSGGGGGTRCDNSTGQPLATTAWPKFRHDNFNTGNAATDPTTGLPGSSVDLGGNPGSIRWQFPAAGEPGKGSFSSSPVIGFSASATVAAPDRLYVGSSDGTFYVLDPHTGAQDLVFADAYLRGFPGVNTLVSSAVVRADGIVAVATGSNTLIVVNPDGSLNRTVTIGGFGAGSPALVMDGTIFIGSIASASGGFLPAVCANGVSRWTFSGDAFEASVAVGPDGTLTDGRVADCTISSDTVPHGLVYAASASAIRPFLRALDRCTGRTKWTFETSALIIASPVVDVANNVVYVWDSAGHLYAVDRLAGTRKAVNGTPFLFAAPGDLQNVASPALGDDGTVYVASTDGKLYAVDPTTALARWSFQTDGPIQSSPAVALDGAQPSLAVASDDGHVYRLVDHGDSASLSWSVDLGSPVRRSSPTIGADGTVYIGTEDGHVYAIDSTP